MSDPFYSNGLQFQCTQCGLCCLFSEGVVYIDNNEEAALADFLNVPIAQFRTKYVEIEQATGLRILKSTPTGACIFFENNQCRVYPARPLQCRTYPFWPENLRSAYQWKQTKQECPGIGQGEWVSAETIENARTAQANHDKQLVQQIRLFTK